MSSTLSPTQSEFSAELSAPKRSADATVRPANQDQVPSKRPSLGRRASRDLARFLITFCIGVAATLAWQSYGDAAREMIARSSPQLGWLAAQAAPIAQPDTIVSAVPAAPSPELRAMSLGLAAVRQSVDQLVAQFAAGQEQMTRDIIKLEAAEQEILHKISSPPPRPAEVPARKPVQLAPAQAAPEPVRPRAPPPG
jgi:hypothetical protein